MLVQKRGDQDRVGARQEISFFPGLFEKLKIKGRKRKERKK